MDPRRWWLLGGVVPTALACLAAVVDPSARLLADGALACTGLLTAVLLWCTAGSRNGPRTGWRLLAVSPLGPVLGALLAVVLQPATQLGFVVARWVPTVPSYGLAVAGLLTLAGRRRLRDRGLRVAVEIVLFLLACAVTFQLLILGPDGRWSALEPAEGLVLGAAVLVLSATMAAALTLLGILESGRRRAGLVLLGAAGLLTAGRGLATAARLAASDGGVDASRFLVLGGIALLVVGRLVDPGPGVEQEDSRRTASRSTALSQLLPHAAMVVAAAVVATDVLLGHRPDAGTIAGLVSCVALAAVHRWLCLGEEQRMSVRLQRSESYFRSLVGSGGDAVLILSGDLRLTWASTALERILGVGAAARLTGRPLLEVVHPEDVAALTAALPRPGGTTAEGRPVDAALILLRLQDTSGTWRFLEAGVSDLRADASVGAVVLHCRDMTERLSREQALQSVAYTDPMTGLPNRAGWLRALEQAVAEPSGGNRALLLVELDGVAEAREHAGRDVATAVVAEIGRRLRATVRGEDFVGRLGGGAFAIVACGTPEDADQLAARCLAVVEQPIATSAGLMELTAGIGVAQVEDGVPVEELRERVELAVRAARATGPGTAARYSERLGEAAVRRERLRADLEGAGARGELSLAYLPVVALAEQRVCGVEALLRWRHSELGQIPPAEFLPIAERSGLIGPLQRWVLLEAVTAAAALPVAGDPLRIGVNLAGAYLRGGTVVADVQAALDAAGLPPERLVLEITDAALLAADERVGLDVASLRLMGVHVALDDFGTGDSALGHLTALPLDVLKLDVSLVARVDKDPQARALCESIIGIGHALGLDVGAEGVETPAQLAALLGMGCGFAQGFLLGRPTSFDALATLLRDGAGQLWPGLVGQR